MTLRDEPINRPTAHQTHQWSGCNPPTVKDANQWSIYPLPEKWFMCSDCGLLGYDTGKEIQGVQWHWCGPVFCKWTPPPPLTVHRPGKARGRADEAKCCPACGHDRSWLEDRLKHQRQCQRCKVYFVVGGPVINLNFFDVEIWEYWEGYQSEGEWFREVGRAVRDQVDAASHKKGG